jgi:hypothetical protein
MKNLFYLFIGVFLFSCQKENTDLGTEYQSLVGKWEIVNPNAEPARITFKANGKVFIENGADRGSKFKVSEVKELFPPANPTPDTWHTFSLKTNSRDLIVQKKEGFVDTIKSYIGPVLIDDTVGVILSLYFHRIKN